MDPADLVCNTLNEFLLECVSDKIEEVSELPKMLCDIGYLDNKQELIAKTTKCEILDADDASVEISSVSENEIHIQYELVFVLQTFIHSEHIWRVQGCAQAELSIPDANSADWSVFTAQGNNFFEKYKMYKDLVSFRNVIYKEMECDTL